MSSAASLCKFFDYDLEQGAKAFCLIELVLDYIHVLVSTCVVRLAVAKYLNHGLKNVIQWTFFVTYFLFMITLLLQAVLGWLMYFIGYKKRKVIMFQLWMPVAIFNFLIPLSLTVISFLGGVFFQVDDLAKEYLVNSVSIIFVYVLYIELGRVTIGAYIKKLLDEKKGEGEDKAGMEATVASTMEQIGETMKASMEGVVGAPPSVAQTDGDDAKKVAFQIPE